MSEGGWVSWHRSAAASTHMMGSVMRQHREISRDSSRPYMYICAPGVHQLAGPVHRTYPPIPLRHIFYYTMVYLSKNCPNILKKLRLTHID